MIKGFKNRNHCCHLYLLTILVCLICVIACIFIIYGCRLTIFHMIRIIFLIFCCSEFVLLNISIFWSLFNKTLVVKKDIKTYEECLKFFENISICKQKKYYFKILQMVPLMEKGDYDSIEEMLQHFLNETKLNVSNQILLEFYLCLYKKKKGENDKFLQQKNAFCEKWGSRKLNRKLKNVVRQSIDFLECNEENYVTDNKKSILIISKNNIIIKIILIILSVACILCINQMAKRKYSNIGDAYSAGKNIFDCQYQDLNIVYRKDLEKGYIEIAEADKSFFYYIYEKEKISGKDCYYLKNYYGDEKDYLNQCSFSSLIYGQMYRSQRYLSKNNNTSAKSESFPAIGIVNKQNVGKIYQTNSGEPDEIKEIISNEEIYYIWFYKEVTDEEMTNILIE